LKQLNTHWIASIKLGEIVSTSVAIVFDEVILDQERRSLGVGLDLVCMCVSVVQTMSMHLKPLK